MKQRTSHHIQQVTPEDLRRELLEFETKYGMSSADFHTGFTRGEVEDSDDMLEWAGIYEWLCEQDRVVLPARG